MIPDLSKWRTVSDWSKVNVKFMISRATIGQTIDSTLDAFIKGCEEKAIPYWLYVYLKKGDEKGQSEFMVKTCKAKVGKHFVGYILDAEEDNSPSDVKKALDYLTNLGHKTMIYTGYAEYTKYKRLIESRPQSCAWWEARYGKDNGAYSPQYPCHEGVDLHQYTSKGIFQGIGGTCDLSRLTGEKPLEFFTNQEEKKQEVSMSVIIGSARISEKGSIVGAPGDQKQKNTPDYAGEVSLEKYYNHSLGWVVLRAKDTKVAEKLAYDMNAICNNANFGYSQTQRLTGYNAAAKVGFDGAKVREKCNIDCSETVRVCLAYAGIKVADFITSNEVSTIMATGKFEKITTVNEKMLRKGDILVTKKKGHTAIVVDAPTASTEKPKTATTATKPATSGKTTTAKVKTATEAARYLKSQYNKSFTTNQDCNIRNGAGVSKVSLGILPKGTKARCYGYYSTVSGTNWYYVVAEAKGVKYTGFVSGKCLK